MKLIKPLIFTDVKVETGWSKCDNCSNVYQNDLDLNGLCTCLYCKKSLCIDCFPFGLACSACRKTQVNKNLVSIKIDIDNTLYQRLKEESLFYDMPVNDFASMILTEQIKKLMLKEKETK